MALGIVEEKAPLRCPWYRAVYKRTAVRIEHGDKELFHGY
jgi:hypothetical protein